MTPAIRREWLKRVLRRYRWHDEAQWKNPLWGWGAPPWAGPFSRRRPVRRGES